MDAKEQRTLTQQPIPDAELASALAAWFSVSGDMDDFIFYDEPLNAHSER